MFVLLPRVFDQSKIIVRGCSITSIKIQCKSAAWFSNLFFCNSNNTPSCTHWLFLKAWKPHYSLYSVHFGIEQSRKHSSLAGNTHEHTETAHQATANRLGFPHALRTLIHQMLVLQSEPKPSMRQGCFYFIFILDLGEENAQLLFGKVKETAAHWARFREPWLASVRRMH